MMRCTRMMFCLVPIFLSVGAHADTVADLEALREMDRRLAAVAYRLVTANDTLCSDHAPATGMAIHALDQYAPALRPDARRAFSFEAPVAVAALALDGPAARAGVREDDAITAIGGVPLPPLAEARSSTSSGTRDAAATRLAGQPISIPVRLGLKRGGRTLSVQIDVSSGCRARFEVVIADQLFAQADGEVIQLSSRHFLTYDDDGIAVTAAHELAHTVLKHRARLAAAGVRQGFAAKFGRGRRLTRLAEDEADRLSVYLLYNAGYDPMIAVRYWQARTSGKGLMAYRTHAPPVERAALIAREVSRISPGAPRPLVPDMVAGREDPLEARLDR